ncbi:MULTISPECIES: acyl carrier protein [Streptomyces]|uniref:acyl carrier protein n=1 Tax=Streptomyces TaxID=1883 RepID=UPI0029AD3943|nr:acyl carrier protein [Streptomyces sp. AK02-01A]MDX3854945.1 acyl carrier protein [Streptomyces sp. AK02-01A]
MNSIDELIALLRDELGLPIGPEDATRSLDELPGWDSLHLLWLITSLEKRTGRAISIPDVLEAGSLAAVYRLAVAV